MFLNRVIPLLLDHAPRVQGRLELAPGRAVGEFTIHHLISVLLGHARSREGQRRRSSYEGEPSTGALGSTEPAWYSAQASMPYFSSL